MQIKRKYTYRGVNSKVSLICAVLAITILVFFSQRYWPHKDVSIKSNTRLSKEKSLVKSSKRYENSVQGYRLTLPPSWKVVDENSQTSGNVRVINGNEYDGILIIDMRFGGKGNDPEKRNNESLLEWLERISPYKNGVIKNVSHNHKQAFLITFDNISINGGGFQPNVPGVDYVHLLFIERPSGNILELYSQGKMFDEYYRERLDSWVDRIEFIN